MSRVSLVLGVETSSRLVGVALWRDGQALSSLERMSLAPRADDLRAMAERVLDGARVTLADLTGIAVSIGPGSFTGLRIGVSFVKGLATARRVPVIGVSTLDVIAQNLWGARGAVVVLLDARQDKLYAACYRAAAGTLARAGQERLGAIQELSTLLKRGTLFAGDGLQQYGAKLRRLVQRPIVTAPEELWYPRAATVARLGAQLLIRGKRDDIQQLTPRYMYPRYCSIKKGSTRQ